jgi:hypothetical protein
VPGVALGVIRRRLAPADAPGAMHGRRAQIERVLTHTIRATSDRKIAALILIGDAMEERIDRLARLAGDLGRLGVPVFVFCEGADPVAAKAFRQIAELSRGACFGFDLASADRLRDLLGAVAAYAAGGHTALTAYATQKGGEVLRLTAQLRS